MLKAFTLIEILITLALMSIFAVLLFPFTIGTVKNANLSTESGNLASTIFKLQQDAYASENNLNYGIRLGNTSYSILSGANIASMNVSETINLNTQVSIGSINLANGSNEILFSKNNLRPNTTGTFNLTNGTESFTFTINNEGLIEYQKN